MKKRWTRFLSGLLTAAMLSTVVVFAPTSFAAEATLSVQEMKVNSLSEPLGIDQLPKFSWGYFSNINGKEQTAYRIIVASSQEKAEAHEGDIWDSTKIESSQNFDIPYEGTDLASKTEYYWAVECWDENGQSIGWSEVSRFETGMLHPEDWTAEWIGDDIIGNTLSTTVDGCYWIWSLNGSPFDQAPAGHHYFRKTFSVNPNKTVKQVIFGFTADDQGVFYLNGEKIGQTQAWESGGVYDITDKILSGENLIALDGNNTSQGYGGVIGKLTIAYTDDTTDTVITDNTWKVNGIGDSGWEQPGFDDSNWVTPDQNVLYGGDPWGTRVVMEVTNTEPVSAPIFRKEFEVKQEIESARAYICGLGLFDLKINGENPDDTVLNPAHTQYNKTVMYRVFDVTNQLQQGSNAIGVELGKSFYNETVTTWNWQNAVWRDNPKLLMQLEITYQDGSKQIVDTGTDWSVTSNGPTVFDSIYYGETYDARLEKTGFDQPGYKEDDSWHSAVNVDAPTGKLIFQQMEPMRRAETLDTTVTKLDSDSYIIHPEKMTTGWIKLNMGNLPEGTEVTITYGEKLNADGTLAAQGNDSWFIRTIQQDKYIAKGEPGENFEPRFSYKGYEYIQVDGYLGELTSDQIEAYAIHNDVGIPSSFESSNEMINSMHDVMVNTLLNNFQGKPTDTPVWEKNGWTGDANVSTESMAYNFDMRLFLSKFLNDMEDTQTETAIGNIAPSADWSIENTPVWNGIYFLGTEQLYNQFGMKSFVEEQYDAMRKMALVDIKTIQNNGWVWFDTQMGDWVSPYGGTDPNAPGIAMSPEGSAICGTGYVYQILKTMTHMAEVLGKEEDAAEYRAAMEQIYTAFNEKFFDEEKQIYDTNYWIPENAGLRTKFRQTSQLVALAFGLVPEEYKDAVVKNLVNDIVEKGYHFEVGMVGNKLLLPVLSDNGYNDVAYKVLTQTTYPSWGYWLEQGATSAWEGFENTTRSHNHYFLANYEEWLYKGLAGIRDFADGGNTFTIQPQLAGSLEYVDAVTNTAYGNIRSSWKITEQNTEFSYQIPVSTTATIYLPTADTIYNKDHQEISTSDVGIVSIEKQGEITKLVVKSGNYQFFCNTNQSVYKDDLRDAISYADSLQQEDYLQEAWTEFQQVLEQAKSVESQQDTNQIAVNQATNSLEQAIEVLTNKVDTVRKNLKELLQSMSTLSEADFTDHWEDFQAVYEKASALSTDIQATTEQLQKVTDELNQAYELLRYYRTGNIALNSTPTASSSVNGSNGWDIRNLTDGDLKNLSSINEICGWTSNNDINNNHTEWVAVDLGTINRISEVVLYPSGIDANNNAYGMPIDFTIDISDDGINWTTVHTEQNYPLPTSDPQKFVLDQSYFARYVRVHATSLRPKPSDNNLYRMQLVEMEVYNHPVTDAQLTGITLSDGNLEPTFDPSVREYRVEVANDVESILVTPSISQGGSVTFDDSDMLGKDEATGKYLLREGENQLILHVVTEESQAVQSTSITIIREKSEVVDTDKSILNAIIKYAEEAKTSGEYDNAIESVQKTFDAALENAKAVANNAAATQEEVNAAWKTLMNEIHKLGFVAGDKTALASLIEAANGINAELDRYVEAGKAEFTAALEAAQNTYNNGDAMQAEINEVADNLLNAMLNLRYKADKSILEEVVAEAEQSGRKRIHSRELCSITSGSSGSKRCVQQ